jgi:15-cis-phytoene synthase
MSTQQEIFKQGSRTYYNSSLFFPRPVWQDVTDLYAFVRVADNYVDAVPQDGEGFFSFCSAYRASWKTGSSSGSGVIDRFIALQHRKRFDPEWTEAFLHSMELDLSKSVYDTLEETLEYIYGSAEVIGLFMNRIMEVSPVADDSAKLLGRAMQYINFIRDIDEDASFGRRYLPSPPPGLHNLTREAAEASADSFQTYIRAEIARYLTWQKEAEEGYRFLPYRYRVAIKSAADMYAWTAAVIMHDPFVVFRRKVKPSKGRILLQGLFNMAAAAGKRVSR